MIARAGSIEDFIPDLRPYQDRDINAIMDALKRLRSVMYTLPTGGGKTLIGFCVMANWLRESTAGVKGVWLTHGIELEDQAHDDLARQPIDHSRNPTLVSSPLRLYNAMEGGRVSFGARDLLVVDEAHHATARTWARVIQNWPGKVLGLTATPWRLSAKQGFVHLYDTLIAGSQKRFLIENGWLTGAVVKQPRGSGLIRGVGSDSGQAAEATNLR